MVQGGVWTLVENSGQEEAKGCGWVCHQPWRLQGTMSYVSSLPSSPPAPAVIPHCLPASPPSLPSGCDTGLYTSRQGQREGRAGSGHPPRQPRNLTWPGERVSTRLRPPAGWGHPRSPGPVARESRGQTVGRVTRRDRPRACGLHMAPGRQAGAGHAGVNHRLPCEAPLGSTSEPGVKGFLIHRYKCW